ncbi:MAG: DUF4340 domain-containing protein [Oscillospiraceae bacterium]|nr:DUF4340 domain-containing protein [Oscillospiraceae bacterium]
MKQFKPVLIAAIACLVVAAALFTVMKLMPKEAEEITPTNKAENSMLMIIQKSATSVKKVEVKVDSGEKFSIDYSLDDTGNTVATLHGGDKNLTYDQKGLTDLTGYVGFLAAIQEIPDATDKEFGFDKPQREIDIDYTDGEKITLLLGKDAPSGDGIYLKRVDTGIVYLIGGSSSDMLMKTLHDYRVFTLFGPYENTTEIRKVTIEREGEDKLIVEAKSGVVSTSEETAVAQYEITSPAQADVSNEALESTLLKPLIEIASERLVEDNPKDLAKYGLDHPVRVEFEDSDDQTVSFLIGGTSENGGNYVMLDGTSSVIETKEPIPFTTVDYTDLMLKLIFLHNMDTVSSVQYQLGSGVVHNFIINSTSPASATFDGKEVSADNISNLFLLTVRFTLQGKLDSSMKYGDPKLTITLKLKNGNTTTMKLCEINDRHYAAVIDGTARYYVNVNQVNELLTAFDTVKSGGIIPAMFE